MDPKTHGTIRTAGLAIPKDREWHVPRAFPDQVPADTAGACDLVENPKSNEQLVPTP